MAYTLSPPAARTLMAPSSSRSRDTVACVATTPSPARRSTTCDWLVTAWCSRMRAMRCCRWVFASFTSVMASSAALGEQPPQQSPRRVQAVGGLHPDAALRAVDDFPGDLLAAMRGQAVQEDGVRRRLLHEAGVDGEPGKVM